MRRLLLAVACIAAGVAVWAGAAAATPQQTQYGNPAQQMEPVHEAGSLPPGGTTTSTSLPFTGAQLGVALALGIALMGSGIGVRRLGRRRTD